MSTIHETLAPFVRAETNQGATSWSDLETVLVAREDEMADNLRLMAIQFGLYPEIVAECLAQVGLGAPLSEEMRALVHTNFTQLMERLRREHEAGGHDH